MKVGLVTLVSISLLAGTQFPIPAFGGVSAELRYSKKVEGQSSSTKVNPLIAQATGSDQFGLSFTSSEELPKLLEGLTPLFDTRRILPVLRQEQPLARPQPMGQILVKPLWVLLGFSTLAAKGVPMVLFPWARALVILLLP